MSQMLQEKRATRGLRMGALIGEAADQDQQFWGAGIWNEDDSGNESFSEESVKADEFDSDFNDTEDDDDDDDGEDESDGERRAGPANRYKDPSAGRVGKVVVKRKRASAAEAEVVADDEGEDDEDDDDDDDDEDDDDDDSTSKRRRKKKNKTAASRKRSGSPSSSSKRSVNDDSTSAADDSMTDADPSSQQKEKKSKKVRLGNQVDLGAILATDRSVRNSTKSKTEDAEQARQYAAIVAKARPRPQVQNIPRQFTQKELLEDALQTELNNAAWLEMQKLADDQRARDDKPSKARRSEGCIRLLSRRGTYATITFTDVDKMPSVFSLEPPQRPVPRRCVISGLPAKYMDPLTMQPYANVEAFKILRAGGVGPRK